MSSIQACVVLAETLAEALDARDPYTAGHSLRVADYAVAIAQELGLPQKQIEVLRVGAQLHDIGKIGVPDGILLKPGPLSAAEFGLIKLHPQIGRRILEKDPGFDPILSLVELHHENWDGSGYPYNRAGQNIPLEARIVRVADAFDAMITDRSYRSSFSVVRAAQEIRTCSGTHFDPMVARAFLDTLSRGGPPWERLIHASEQPSDRFALHAQRAPVLR